MVAKKKREKKTYEVIVQKWEEVEFGWGSRPDGYSIHLTEADREAWVKEKVEELKKIFGDPPEHNIVQVDGSPYRTQVDAKTYKMLKKAGKGLRMRGPAPEGAVDGWIQTGPGSHGYKPPKNMPPGTIRTH